MRSVRYACERARAVEALERREEHYRSLTENSLDLVSILDLDGTIRYASPSHERILGYQRGGTGRRKRLRLSSSGRCRAGSSGSPAKVQERAPSSTGSATRMAPIERWNPLAANLSHLAGVGGVVVNSRDVTERKRLEEQLHHSQRIEAMGRLAGGVAHDFNNLLMVIAGHSQMLLDSMLPGDPARDDLEQVVKATQRATDLTRQLLAFSRRQAVKPAFLNLNLMVQHSERMLKRVLGENIQLIANLAPDVQSIYADPGQLEQVILNLALNARDAMPQGGTLTLATKQRHSRRSPVRDATRCSRSATPVRALRARCCRMCSSRSSPPRSMAPVWGFPPVMESSSKPAARSRWIPNPAPAQLSAFIFPRPKRRPSSRSHCRRALLCPAPRQSCWWKTRTVCAAFWRPC